MLVNRLVLNLSNSVDTGENSDSRSRAEVITPAFSTNAFLGNIGGSVHTVQGELHDDQYQFEVEQEGPVDISFEDVTKTEGDLEFQQITSRRLTSHLAVACGDLSFEVDFVP